MLDAVFLNSVQLGLTPDEPPLEFATDMAESVESSASRGSTLLCPWLTAVRSSTHWNNLVAALRESVITQAQAEQIAKLLKVRELWARSYELYIARRSTDRVLKHQMGVECSESAQIGSILVYNYWQDGDFDAIQAELDTILRRLGWLMI